MRHFYLAIAKVRKNETANYGGFGGHAFSADNRMDAINQSVAFWKSGKFVRYPGRVIAIRPICEFRPIPNLSDVERKKVQELLSQVTTTVHSTPDPIEELASEFVRYVHFLQRTHNV